MQCTLPPKYYMRVFVMQNFGFRTHNQSRWVNIIYRWLLIECVCGTILSVYVCVSCFVPSLSLSPPPTPLLLLVYESRFFVVVVAVFAAVWCDAQTHTHTTVAYTTQLFKSWLGFGVSNRDSRSTDWQTTYDKRHTIKRERKTKTIFYLLGWNTKEKKNYQPHIVRII